MAGVHTVYTAAHCDTPKPESSAWQTLPVEEIARLTGAVIVADEAGDMQALRDATHAMHAAGLMHEIPIV